MSRRPPVRHMVKGYTTKDGRKVPAHYRGSGRLLTDIKRAGQVVGRGAKIAGQLAGYEIERRHKERLLEECFTGTKAQRLAARFALKRYYPELFEDAGFSEKNDRRRKPPKVKNLRINMIPQRGIIK